MNVCVVALGKIGLPLAVQFARSGHQVIGADVNAATVEMINNGVAPFPGEADLDEWLAEEVGAGRLAATTDTVAAVAASEVVVIVVPLIVDERGVPDFGPMDAATRVVAKGLRPGTLVSYETTLPVGITRGRFAPALVEASGLELGVDLFVCHSPERVFSGRIFSDLRRYPKIVGGLDPASARRAVEFYETALQFDERPDLQRPNGVWDLGSAEAAELTKLAETTYRDINIAYANELARFADRQGIDVMQVIEASNSQVFSHIHRPGVAVGGHCIPVYPRFYLSVDPDALLPAIARQINESMPAYAVDLLGTLLGPLEGRRIVVLGAAYRGGVKETAFSGVFPLVAVLEARGAVAVVHDPMYSDDELRALGLEPHHLGESCDGVIVQTDHREYAALGPVDLPGCRALVDGRGVTTADGWASAGVSRVVLGRAAGG